MDKSKLDEQPSIAETERTRKPYNPPKIEESGCFEHLVLACMFAPMGQGACSVEARSTS